MTRKWNNLSKRGLALFLALVMCLGMLPAAAFAAGEETAVCPVCEGAGMVEGTCPDCEGTGKVSDTSKCPDCEEPPVCEVCHGTHEVETSEPCTACADWEEPRVCEVCDGKGEVAGEVTVDCDVCGGTGKVADLETEEPADCEACEGTGKTTKEGLVRCEACADWEEPQVCAVCKGTHMVTTTEPCAACADWEEPETCLTCGGTRKVTNTEDCARCEGTGTVGRTCPECGGSGEVAVKHEEPKDDAGEAAVQAFLDAVATIPAVSRDNAAEVFEYVYGEVSDAYAELLGTEYEDRADVQAAVDHYAAAIDAAETALGYDSTTYEASGTSLFDRTYHIYAEDGNLVYELAYGLLRLNVDVGVGETWTDEGVMLINDKGRDIYKVTDWSDVKIWSTNESVLKVHTETNGATLRIIYEGVADGTASIKIAFHATTTSTGQGIYGAGNVGAAAVGAVTIGTAAVGTGINSDYGDGGIEVDGGEHWVFVPEGKETMLKLVAQEQWRGDFYYNPLTNQKTAEPTLRDPNKINDKYANVTVNYGNWGEYDNENAYWEADVNITGLNETPAGTVIPVFVDYTVLDVIGKNGTWNLNTVTAKVNIVVYKPETFELEKNAEPEMYEFTEWMSNGWETFNCYEYPSASTSGILNISNVSLGTDFHENDFTSWPGYTVQGTTVTRTPVSVSACYEWEVMKIVGKLGTDRNSPIIAFPQTTHILDVANYIVSDIPDTTEYTVTYTDGVDNVTVFPDDSYTGLHNGDLTPAFNKSGKLNEEVVNAQGDPIRNGYIFKGWTPERKAMVSGGDAKDGKIIYTAQWEKINPDTIKVAKVAKDSDENDAKPVTEVNVGDEFVYWITVSNANSAPVKVTVTDALDTNLTWVKASDSGQYNETTRTVTWTDVTVPASGSKTVCLTVKATKAGKITNSATVTWPDCDPDKEPTGTAPEVEAVDSPGEGYELKTVPYSLRFQAVDKPIGWTVLPEDQQIKTNQVPAFKLVWTYMVNNKTYTGELLSKDVTPTEDRGAKFTWDGFQVWVKKGSTKASKDKTYVRFTLYYEGDDGKYVKAENPDLAITGYSGINSATDGFWFHDEGMGSAEHTRHYAKPQPTGITKELVTSETGLPQSAKYTIIRAYYAGEECIHAIASSVDAAPVGSVFSVKGWLAANPAWDYREVDGVMCRFGVTESYVTDYADTIGSGNMDTVINDSSTREATEVAMTEGEKPPVIILRYDRVQANVTKPDDIVNATYTPAAPNQSYSGGTVTIPEDGSVTLLYKLTVTGTAGAKYVVTDTGATWAGGEGTQQADGTIKGTIPTGGKAVIYVTKSFTANDIKDDKVVNEATVKGVENPAKAETPAEVESQTAPALTITKTVDKTSVKVGGTLTYTITVDNTQGTAAANNVVVKDELPAVLTYVSNSTKSITEGVAVNQPSATGNNLTWTLAKIEAGKAVSFTFKAKNETYDLDTEQTFNTPGKFTNTATVSCTEIPEDSKNPIKDETPETYVYKLAVTKSNTGFTKDETAKNKATVRYTVTVTNESGYALHGAGILDTLNASVLNSETNQAATGVTMTLKPVSMTLPNGTVIKAGDEDAAAILGEDKPVASGKNENLWNALGRDVEFAKGATITLVYDIEMVNTSTVKVYVALNNTAMGGAWTTAENQGKARMMKAQARDGSVNPGWDATDEDSNKVSIGTSSSGGFLDPVDPEAKYTVKWIDPDKGIDDPVKTENNVTLNKDGTVPGDKYPSKEQEPTTPGNWGDPVIDDKTKTVTITWVKDDTVKVTFDSNGGKGTIADVTVTKGGTVGTDMPANPTKDNAVFAGWNTKQDGTGDVFTKDTPVNGNITVYAQWDDDKFGPTSDTDPTLKEEPDGIADKFQPVVTYKVKNGSWNEGENDKADKKVVVTLRKDGEPSLDGTATLSAPAVGGKPDTGFKAGGWDTDPKDVAFNKDSAKEYTYTYAGDSKVTYPEYKEEDGKPVPPTDGSDDVNKGTVIIVDPTERGTWDHGKEEGYWTPEGRTYRHTVAEGETVSLTPDPTKSDFVFVGWKKTSEVTDPVTNVTTITYTAQWAKDKVNKDDPATEGSDGIPDVWQAKVTLSIVGGIWNARADWKNGEGTDLVKVFDLYTQNEGKWSKVDNVTVGTLPTGTADSTHTGTGSWDDSTLSATTPVVDGASYTLSFSPVGTTTYTLYYSANGGSGAPSSWSVTVPTGSGARTTTVSTTTPYRSGYTFQGWSLNSNGSGTRYYSGNSITLAGSVTLYAVWSYNGGGGGGGGTYRPSTGGGGGGGTGGGTVNIDDPDVPLAGGSELNREDHFAYISGYPDGTVQPTNNITREEVAAIFYRLLTDTSRTIYETDVNDFSDVDSGRWSNRAISTLVNAGILSGYPDGTFRPGQSITRAEFATIAAQFEVVTEDVENPFSDTTGHWAETLISFAASKGWVGGYTDGTFKPQRAITRAEAMTLVNNVLEREVDEEGLLADAKQWPDNKKDAWYYYEVLEATNSHDYTRRGSGTVENWTAITND